MLGFDKKMCIANAWAKSSEKPIYQPLKMGDYERFTQFVFIL